MLFADQSSQLYSKNISIYVLQQSSLVTKDGLRTEPKVQKGVQSLPDGERSIAIILFNFPCCRCNACPNNIYCFNN